MSTYTYAACYHCRERLCVDKFWHYRAEPGDHYSFAKKARALATFFDKHAGEACDVAMFDEHADAFNDTFAFACWDEDGHQLTLEGGKPAP
jgi:hypothetical protein